MILYFGKLVDLAAEQWSMFISHYIKESLDSTMDNVQSYKLLGRLDFKSIDGPVVGGPELCEMWPTLNLQAS